MLYATHLISIQYFLTPNIDFFEKSAFESGLLLLRYTLFPKLQPRLEGGFLNKVNIGIKKVNISHVAYNIIHITNNIE